MLDSLYLRLADLSPAALIIIPLAIMFFCAFGMTRITKRLRLPSVTAYLTAGILGAAPRVAAATVLGSALWNPGTPRFWMSLGIGGALTALALVLWRCRQYHA